MCQSQKRSENIFSDLSDCADYGIFFVAALRTDLSTKADSPFV